jgi:hypothetical protein
MFDIFNDLLRVNRCSRNHGVHVEVWGRRCAPSRLWYSQQDVDYDLSRILGLKPIPQCQLRAQSENKGTTEHAVKQGRGQKFFSYSVLTSLLSLSRELLYVSFYHRLAPTAGLKEPLGHMQDAVAS